MVLASATPSLESWANVEAGKYARLDLTAIGSAQAVMPKMAAMDMRAEDLPGSRWISPTLVQRRFEARMEKGEQSLRVPEPSRLCAGDHLPGLWAPDRL